MGPYNNCGSYILHKRAIWSVVENVSADLNFAERSYVFGIPTVTSSDDVKNSCNHPEVDRYGVYRNIFGIFQQSYSSYF